MQYVPLYLQETLPSIKSPAHNNKTILVRFARKKYGSILMMASRQAFTTLSSFPIIPESENSLLSIIDVMPKPPEVALPRDFNKK
jgi:hypothetical protein